MNSHVNRSTYPLNEFLDRRLNGAFNDMMPIGGERPVICMIFLASVKMGGHDFAMRVKAANGRKCKPLA